MECSGRPRNYAPHIDLCEAALSSDGSGTMLCPLVLYSRDLPLLLSGWSEVAMFDGIWSMFVHNCVWTPYPSSIDADERQFNSIASVQAQDLAQLQSLVTAK